MLMSVSAGVGRLRRYAGVSARGAGSDAALCLMIACVTTLVLIGLALVITLAVEYESGCLAHEHAFDQAPPPPSRRIVFARHPSGCAC